MNPEVRATWGDGWIKGIGAKFAEVENQADQAYSLAINSALGVEQNSYTRLFKGRSSTQSRETLTNKTGVGYPRFTTEGQDYAKDSRYPGYKTEFNFIKKTNAVEITEEQKEDVEDDLRDKMDEARDINVGFKMEFDRSAFSIFNYAFTAQASLPVDLTFYADGKPMCSIAHPRKDGGTAQSNADAAGRVLDDDNIETLRQQLRRQLDDRGLPMNIGSGSVILLVPDSLEKKGKVLTGSEKKAETANNDLNIYRGGWMPVMSTKWINSQNGGSDTAWFLIDTMYSPTIFYERRGIRSSVYVDNANKDTIYDASARWQVGNKNWRGIVGSKGDGAAYSG